MSFNIRKLGYQDLSLVIDFAEKKLSQTGKDFSNFNLFGSEKIFQLYLLPAEIYGSENYEMFGCFDGEELQAILGLRFSQDHCAWILSFIFTKSESVTGISTIKNLVKYVVEHQESKGIIQWFVVSNLEDFKSWQRLFKNLRSKYHHYIYAKIEANSVPQSINLLKLTGNKLFPYDIVISMYMAKSACTSEEE